MPEFVEAEAYRRTIEPLVGNRVDGVDVRDDRLLRRGDEAGVLVGVLGGSSITAARRIGKALLLDTSSGHTVTLSFGLRGWLSVDDEVARADGTRRRRVPRPEHVRLHLDVGGHAVDLEDQLRLATVELDVDETRYGTDVLDLDKNGFTALLGSSSAAVKSVLMDQRRIAGIGNLIADEILYQGKVDPRRPAGELCAAEQDDLWVGLRRTRERVLTRNGSHQGVMIQAGARERGANCPRDGAPIERVKVAGRTTYFCPEHQR